MIGIGNISKIKIPDNFKIDISKTTLTRKIVKPQSFCQVNIVKYQDQIYVNKIIHKQNIPPKSYEEQYERIQLQINILYKLNHPNIIKLYYHEETEDQIYLLMEYGGTRLRGMFKDKLKTQEDVVKILKQIVMGLKQIHQNGFIHRDLSPQNILVKKENQVKIVDFGFANQLNYRKTKLGDFVYMAPEIDGETIYNQKADIWSLGVIAYEMLHLDTPFCSKKQFNQQVFIHNRNQLKYQIGNISEDAADFLQKTLVIIPEKRFNTVQLLQHPFLSDGQHSFAFDIFDKREDTEKKNRKTSKLFNREMLAPQKQSDPIYMQEKKLKHSLGQVFACLHHQRDIASDILNNYRELLAKEISQRQKQGKI